MPSQPYPARGRRATQGPSFTVAPSVPRIPGFRANLAKGINAALCGTWGCPVLMVTGDEASCTEAKDLLGAGQTTVAVKRGIGALSARMIPLIRARQMIEDGAKRAPSDLKAVAPYDPGRPCEIKVEFKNTVAPTSFASVPA